MGDFNYDRTWPEEKTVYQNEYADVVTPFEESQPELRSSRFAVPKYSKYERPPRFDKVIAKNGGRYKAKKCKLVGDYCMIEGETLEMSGKDGKIRAPSDHIGVLVDWELQCEEPMEEEKKEDTSKQP